MPSLSRILAVLVLISGFHAYAQDVLPDHVLEHVPGEVVVKFRDGASSRAGFVKVLSTIRSRLGAESVQTLQPLETDPSVAVVKMQDDGLTASALHVLEGEPAVVYSEPNYIYHISTVTADAAHGVPNDANFAKQWNMYNGGQKDAAGKTGVPGIDLNILPLWQQGIVGKKDVVVAIIDTGIQWDHPDLKNNIYTNPGEIANNRKDDDDNGYIDDIHGWNFSKNGANSNDDNGHGTHCAGVIGAAGNNKIGVSGVNWKVSLMPVKFLSKNGSGSMTDAVNAINYARKMKVNIMSNSWGGGGFSQTVYDAVKAASDAGILFVAAAGNDGKDNDGRSPSYPASFDLPNVVSVAAIDNNERLAKFSNYGATRVHVAAPGVNIFSTYKKSGYKSLSGTSMAAPHVAGIAALMLSESPNLTAEEVKSRLIKTSAPSANLSGKVASQGRVDATAAVTGR
jgi:subtilisin family serine protease